MSVSFRVYGQPVAQGSKKVIRGHLVEMADERLRSWRQDVAAAADQAMGSERAWSGPVVVELTFYFTRPKNQYGTGRNADILKPSAPAYPAVHPDIDKLARATLDAMTAIVFEDDRQVVSLELWKLYAERPGLWVEASQLRPLVA